MDDFKDVNDRYGHVTGDELLRTCCHFRLKYFGGPGRSFLARYGGDEFVITAITDTYGSFCDSISHLTSAMRRTIVLPDGGTIPFSFTMGRAFPTDGRAHVPRQERGQKRYRQRNR